MNTTRSYTEMKVGTDYFCPWCGARDVWCEEGDGDYYAGPEYGCRKCRCLFSMPYGPTIVNAFPPRWEGEA